MNAREAIDAAKAYVADVFASEGVVNIGLEELRYREYQNVWEVTVGFTRPWDQSRDDATARRGILSQLTPLPTENGRPLPRTFKLVEIRDSDGEVLGLSDRPLAA